jgi:hypothetical protein
MIANNLDGDFEAASARTIWMPAHGAAHTIGKAVDSKGMPITNLMWRANRLVDELAKAAASTHRLPKWVVDFPKIAATFVRYHAAKLGFATHEANNHNTTIMVDGGMIVDKIMRDSTAERPNWRLRKRKVGKKRPAEELSPAVVPEPLSSPSVGAPQLGSSNCKQARAMPTSTAAAQTARGKKRRAAAEAQRCRQEVADFSLVARWVASRKLIPPTAQPSAKERVAALRARRLSERLACAS